MIATTIEIFKPDGATDKLNIEGGQQLGFGNEAIVYRVDTEIDGRRQSMAFKKYTLPTPEMNIDHAVAMHQVFKDHNLAVPEQYLKARSGILMTDLTQNGANLVVSFNDSPRTKFSGPTNQELYTRFQTVDLDQVENVYQTEFEKLRAARIAIVHIDCWFLVVNPLGAPSVVHTDFGSTTQMDYQYRSDVNQRQFDGFLKNLRVKQRK